MRKVLVLLVLGLLWIPNVASATIEVLIATGSSSPATPTWVTPADSYPSYAPVGGATNPTYVTLKETLSGTTDLNTPTVSIPAGTKVTLSSYIPATAQGFEISIWGDEGVVNNPSDIATGTFSCGWRISSGTSRIWGGAPGTQVLATRNGLVATITIVAW